MLEKLGNKTNRLGFFFFFFFFLPTPFPLITWKKRGAVFFLSDLEIEEDVAIENGQCKDLVLMGKTDCESG